MKHLFRPLTCVVIATVILFTGCKPDHTFIHAEGQILVDPTGKPFTPKGTNLGNWLVPEGYMFKTNQVNSPYKINELLNQLVGPDQARQFWDTYLDDYITEADIKYLASLGFNHLRVPFDYRLLTDEDFLNRNQHGFKYLDRVVDWCRAAGMYVMLDMHCAPCGQTGDNIDDSYGYPFLFESQNCQDEFVNIWEMIARHYQDEPVIMGYDLMNEPIATYFESDIPRLNQSLIALYKRTTNAIRKIDKQHLIVLGGAQWDGNFKIFDQPFDDNLLYEFHKYWFPVEQAAVQEYVDFREKYNVPIYMGESGENSDEWVASFRELLDQNKIGWAFWPYKKMNNTAGIMNFTEPDKWSLITQFANGDRGSYKAIRENRPDPGQVQTALDEFLVNCQFENCFPNAGYVKALVGK